MAEIRSGDIEVVERLLGARYSCRAFRPEPVPRETIARILATAQKTASWCNSQPWQVAVFSGAATQRFAEALYAAASGGGHASDFPFPREYRGKYLERRRESGFQLYNALGIARGDKAAYQKQMLENFRFFGAPHVAIITTDEALGIYGAVDCGAYVANFMLAAQALGVATVRRRRLPAIRRWCARISASATTAAWSAASPSAMRTRRTPPTATAPAVPGSPRPRPSSTRENGHVRHRRRRRKWLTGR